MRSECTVNACEAHGLARIREGKPNREDKNKSITLLGAVANVPL